MTATPALASGLAGQYQKKISDMLYLDRKDSEFVLLALEQYAWALMDEWESNKNITWDSLQEIPGNDPGDEQEGV